MPKQLPKAGPLDENSRRLVKLALSIGAGLDGATHSAVRNAHKADITPEEIGSRGGACDNHFGTARGHSGNDLVSDDTRQTK